MLWEKVSPWFKPEEGSGGGVADGTMLPFVCPLMLELARSLGIRD